MSSRPARLAVVVATLLAAGGALALSGCSQIDSQLNQQIAIVRFRPGTTVATVLQARQACAHIPDLKLLPPNVHPGQPTSPIALRYGANRPTEHTLSQLQACVQKFPDVTGVAIIDSAGRGL